MVKKQLENGLLYKVCYILISFFPEKGTYEATDDDFVSHFDDITSCSASCVKTFFVEKFLKNYVMDYV